MGKPKFWATADDLNRLVELAEFSTKWDFADALGDTIMEKYEALYLKLRELTEQMVAQGVRGYFWMATSPEVAALFETSPHSFRPTKSEDYICDADFEVFGVHPKGTSVLYDCGTVNGNWHLYKSVELPKNVILVGVNNREQDPSDYGCIWIENYVV
jgi:hypothetical protein